MLLLVFILCGVVIPRVPFLASDTGALLSVRSLRLENQMLRQQISHTEAELVALREGYVLPASEEYFPAKVFSLYPFRTKRTITISAGGKDGIIVGQSVTVGEATLLGQVIKVSDHTSNVITLFDTRFSLPVRIGDQEIEGLLEGGANPTINLIDPATSIHAGDVVAAAARDIPYGLVIGTIDSVRSDASGSFLEASISLPYTFNNIRDVFVIVR